MKRFFWLTFLFFASITLQSTILGKIAIDGIKPDLLLVIVIFYALIYGSRSGAILGLIYGLFEDIATGRFIGINAVSKMITGYLIGLGEGKLYSDNIFVPVVGIFIGSVINYFSFFVLGVLGGMPVVLTLEVFFHKAFLAIVYNVCLAPFLLGRYYKLAK